MENSESKNNSTDHFSVNSLDTLISNFDHAFLIMMGIIIIFMQAGFGFLEAGSIRAKNTTNILIKNYADLCMGGIAFWLTGYSFAFGEHNPFIGLDHFALINTPRSDHSFFFFQASFLFLLSPPQHNCYSQISISVYFCCHLRNYCFWSYS